jgi:hypothetical protein
VPLLKLFRSFQEVWHYMRGVDQNKNFKELENWSAFTPRRDTAHGPERFMFAIKITATETSPRFSAICYFVGQNKYRQWIWSDKSYPFYSHNCWKKSSVAPR